MSKNNNPVILVATQKNGLQIYKQECSQVGGYKYFTEENSPSDYGPQPALHTALISTEALELILNDIKKASYETQQKNNNQQRRNSFQ